MNSLAGVCQISLLSFTKMINNLIELNEGYKFNLY